MIYMSEIVSAWPVIDGWSISPGVLWCAEGNHIRVGFGCTIGFGCTLGDYCTLGHRCAIGYYCTLGDYCKLGDYCTLGTNCTLGNNAADPIDLGVSDDCRKCVCSVDGVAYIGAGCRWFSLSDALVHWGNHKRDRCRTVAQMKYAKALAEINGWSINGDDNSEQLGGYTPVTEPAASDREDFLDELTNEFARPNQNWDKIYSACRSHFSKVPAGMVLVPKGAVEALKHQRQCDEDGTEIAVSRQAVDEIISAAPQAEKNVDLDESIRIGDKVRTGVYVLNEFRPVWLGEVISISSDGVLAQVDIGTMHGAAKHLLLEQISHLRKEAINHDN